MFIILFKRRTRDVKKTKENFEEIQSFLFFFLGVYKKGMVVPQRLHVFDEKEISFSQDIVHTLHLINCESVVFLPKVAKFIVE
jgi:hypothetical protein